jgi:hypothetical protein
MAWEAVVSVTWRDERRRSIDLYGVVRGAIALLILGVVLLVIAVPTYIAMQVALTFVGVNP